MGLKTAFEGLGLNSKPKYNDEGELQEGTNDCFSLHHYDGDLSEDSDNLYGPMKSAKDQHYYVGGTQYSVGHNHLFSVLRAK
jgi:hypothetical protein